MRRAIEVLFCFDDGGLDLSSAEIAERLDMNRTTAYRCLQTLASTGLVAEVGSGRFALGARTVSLADAYTRHWRELDALAAEALVRLRDATGETAGLHLRQGDSRVVVRQVESHHELHRTYRELGQPIPLLSGAPSLAILAALPARERDDYLRTHAPVEERPRLEAVIAEAVERGFVSSRGSRVPGVASVAAAIRGPDGRVVAAINVTGPEDRLPPARTGELAAHVLAESASIERELAGRSSAARP